MIEISFKFHYVQSNLVKDGLDLHFGALQRQLFHSHTAPGRQLLPLKILRIDLINGREVPHIRQKDSRLDRIAQSETIRLSYGFDVLESSISLSTWFIGY